MFWIPFEIFENAADTAFRVYYKKIFICLLTFLNAMIEEIFPNVFKVKGKLATKNLITDHPVYGERIVKLNGCEYRLWNPYRSKLAAAILSGLTHMVIEPGATVLYLGAATGTTCSHVSDIVGREGTVYCVEFSPESMQKLVEVCRWRDNMVPIFADARNPDEYFEYVDPEELVNVDVIYEDVAQPDQIDILVRNSERFLKRNGYVMLAVKSQSIDVSKPVKVVFEEVINEFSKNFQLIEQIDIHRFEKDHIFLVGQKL